MDFVWSIFCQELNRTSCDHQLLVHSFVLMSNHFHLIASTPLANISDCMQQFMTRTSRHLTRSGNRINETYAGRHYKSILIGSQAFECAYKYNYRNPVAAGICKQVQEYRYSSLFNLLNPVQQSFPISEDLLLLSEPRQTMQWLNTPPEPEKLEAVRFALKRKYFKLRGSRNGRKPLFDEGERL